MNEAIYCEKIRIWDAHKRRYKHAEFVKMDNVEGTRTALYRIEGEEKDRPYAYVMAEKIGAAHSDPNHPFNKRK